MISDDLTLSEFGYLPSDLSPCSTKPVIVICDFCNERFTRKFLQFRKPSRKPPHACRGCDQIKSNWTKNNPDGLSPRGFFESYPRADLSNVLLNETMGTFGYDPSTLSHGSCRKVVAGCSFCHRSYETTPQLIRRNGGRTCCKRCSPTCSVWKRTGSDLDPHTFHLSRKRSVDTSGIDVTATTSRFGYDPLSISPGSEKYVVVRCAWCGARHTVRMDHYVSSGPRVTCGDSRCKTEKIKETLVERYGVPTVMDIPEVRESLRNPITERIVEAVLRHHYQTKYVRWHVIGPYSFDFLVPSADLLIECQGDYFHDFKRNGYSGTPRDKAKSTYVEKYTSHKLVWIWKHEIHAGRIKKILDFHFGRLTVPEMKIDVRDMTARRIDIARAHSFLSCFHYMGNVGTAATPYGGFHDDDLVTVAVFGGLTRKETGESIGSRYEVRGSIRELRRFCLRPNTRASNMASRFMSLALSEFKRDRPECKMIVTFSDPTVGDTGGMYTACNFKRDGVTSASYHYVDPSTGKPIHKKTVYRMAQDSHMRESEFVKKTGFKKVAEKPKTRWIKEL